MTKIVCISDTHSFHGEVVLPDGDVLIHAGDITHQGEVYILNKFLKWFDSQPHKYKIFIAGNHDWCFDKRHYLYADTETIIKKYEGKIKFLHHESYVIPEYGIKFFGSPYTPFFCNWAFNVHRGFLCHYWDQIDDDTNVLITHGPCYGILDANNANELCGDAELLHRVKQLKLLQYHIFGHIHTNGPIQKKKIDNVTFVNASVLNENYELKNKPVVIQYKQNKKNERHQ